MALTRDVPLSDKRKISDFRARRGWREGRGLKRQEWRRTESESGVRARMETHHVALKDMPVMVVFPPSLQLGSTQQRISDDASVEGLKRRPAGFQDTM